MTTATLTPFDLAEAKQVGRRTYRKQVLPLGSINYEGQKITFDQQFLTDLATSFQDGAYDQVPVQFADGKNRHNLDPKLFGGEVKGLELTNDGLDAIVELSEEAAKVVGQNPKLGVSARIMTDLSKVDGRSFKRAINHVLLTLDPRVTQMRPWQAVDLSAGDEGTEVVDLTAATYQEETPMGKETKVADKTATLGDKEIDLSALSDEQFELLLATATEVDPEADEKEKEGEEDDGEDDATTLEGLTTESFVTIGGKRFKLTPAGVEDTTAGEGGAAEGEGAADLSNPIVDEEARGQVATMRIDLAESKWNEERGELLRAGVPPVLLDLAAPILSSPDEAVIDLSNADKPHNASETVRKMLDTCKGLVDLSSESGHTIDLSDKDDPAAELLNQWDTEYGKA